MGAAGDGTGSADAAVGPSVDAPGGGSDVASASGDNDRRDRTGERAIHAKASKTPTPATAAVARSPTASARKPPTNAPSGAAPMVTTRIEALTRPRNESGASACAALAK